MTETIEARQEPLREAKLIDGRWCVGMKGNLDTIHDAEVIIPRQTSDGEAAKALAEQIVQALAALSNYESMRKALEPFAKVADEWDAWQLLGSTSRPDDLSLSYGGARITLADYRAARQALKGEG